MDKGLETLGAVMQAVLLSAAGYLLMEGRAEDAGKLIFCYYLFWISAIALAGVFYWVRERR